VGPQAGGGSGWPNEGTRREKFYGAGLVEEDVFGLIGVASGKNDFLYRPGGGRVEGFRNSKPKHRWIKDVNEIQPEGESRGSERRGLLEGGGHARSK